MNTITIIFLLVNTLALFLLPRRLAPMSLLVGACYMPMGVELVIGPFHFTVIRILVAAGVVRIFLRKEQLTGGMNSLDRLMVAWSAWVLFVGIFHNDPSSGLIFRLGMVYNACGIYFLLRVFCKSIDDIVRLCRITAILLVPVALEMLYEKLTSHNLFSLLGGVSEILEIRNAKIRAQGPFAHSILAGTIGAVCLPLSIALWRLHRKEAVIGMGACFVIIFASASSGPIMSAIAALGALWFWRYRHKMRLIRWLAVFGYIGLDLVMKAPAYYLISRIDLAGGSTGYYRSRLLQSAFEHFSEWWLVGTDFTRDWMDMENVAGWNANHTDITNYYLHMGVLGGVPLMLLFMAILAKGFSFVGQALRKRSELTTESRFMIWALGASLFALATSFISVTYFDQSFVFLYLVIAAISSARFETVRVTDDSMNKPYVSDQPGLAERGRIQA